MKFRATLAAGLLVAAAGCSQSEQPAASGVLPTDTGATGAATAPSGGSTGGIAQTYLGRLDQFRSQVQSMASQARSLGDDRLDGIMASINQKLETAQAKVDQLADAKEGAVARIEAELETLMSDVADLYKQATARVTELGTSSLPGGLKIPGGG